MWVSDLAKVTQLEAERGELDSEPPDYTTS